jgi:sterol desaturase/sphingolipid hydroxylase (fatty acid hydroxylase superfamily)
MIMEQYLQLALPMRLAITMLVGFGAMAALFGLAERRFKLRPQRTVWRVDVLHYFLSSAITRIATILVVGAIASRVAYPGWLETFRTSVGAQPLVLQFLEAVFIQDLAQYLFHRLSHGVPVLWRFHAIHHSSEHVDWLANARFHPVDQVIGRIGTLAILSVLGLSESVFLLYWLVISPAHSVFVHSNIKLRFPVLRQMISTPEYHHWHHAKTTKDTNYARFPIIDRLFGTFDFPTNRRPSEYGTDTQIPSSYWRQISAPFVELVADFRRRVS